MKGSFPFVKTGVRQPLSGQNKVHSLWPQVKMTARDKQLLRSMKKQDRIKRKALE